MNILFDLLHSSDINLFKNAIKYLEKEQHNIIITIRQRGRLEAIARNEFPNINILKIGKHRKNIFLKIFGQISRELEFIKFFRANKINVSVNQGFANIIAAKVYRIPFLQFEDDFEYKLAFYYVRYFCTRDIMPSFIPVNNNNIVNYKGFKELAYLHPNYFTPNLDELKKYNIKPNNYVFIREVANVSLNYKKSNLSIFKIREKIKKLGLKIMLSLEDKKISYYFKEDCIILEEPVDDIFSLMKYALFTISSGDTMARESCLLGTPTIYTGRRNMVVNKPLLELGCMFKEDTENAIFRRINSLFQKNLKEKIRGIIEDNIKNKWEDTTAVVIKHILDFQE